MVPYQLENKLGLTAESSAGLDEMVTGLVKELANLGIQLELREKPKAGHWKQQSEREVQATCV